MRHYAIQNPQGRFNYFRESAQASKDAILAKHPFGATWSALRRQGFKCVKVEVRVLEDCSAGG